MTRNKRGSEGWNIRIHRHIRCLGGQYAKEIKRDFDRMKSKHVFGKVEGHPYWGIDYVDKAMEDVND